MKRARAEQERIVENYMNQFTKPTKAGDIQRTWHLFDAKDKILGRIATVIAQSLIGKDKPYFVKNLDCGDYAVVVNAKHVAVSGKKEKQKVYDRFSGYPGGRHVKTLTAVRSYNPQRIITEAVAGMLPKNKLRAAMLKRLFVFADENHPYKNKFTNSNIK